jgi:hypothetical protein
MIGTIVHIWHIFGLFSDIAYTSKLKQMISLLLFGSFKYFISPLTVTLGQMYQEECLYVSNVLFQESPSVQGLVLGVKKRILDVAVLPLS